MYGKTHIPLWEIDIIMKPEKIQVPELVTGTSILPKTLADLVQQFTWTLSQ
jgi:hypothetical protein